MHKTTPQARWDAANGYISKSYRMYRRDAEAFAEACKRAGVSQSGKITQLMRDFCIEQGVDLDEKAR